MKSLTRWAWAAGDVAVAEVLADDRAVLALDEGVVVGVSGSGLGELVDVEGFEQRGDGAVDVFRAVVGVKAVEGEGEGSEQGAEDRRQARGMEVLDRADELELGDLVHQVHVVQAFQVIQIGLVDGIDPDIAGAPETASADGARQWRPGLGASGWRWFRGAVDTWSSAAGCRGGRWRCRPGVRTGGRQSDGRRAHRACAWPARTRCRGAGRARREARCRCSCSGGGTAVGAPRGGRRCSR